MKPGADHVTVRGVNPDYIRNAQSLDRGKLPKAFDEPPLELPILEP
jgi:hypothetical protein